MQAIMMSVRPRHVCNILNLIKLWEIRKIFPNDFVGWVYIYCTKVKGLLSDNGYGEYYIVESKECKDIVKSRNYYSNGKVVARFWCDKVDTFRCNITGNLKDGFFNAEPYCKVIEVGIAKYNCNDEFEEILKNAQITNKELAQYLGDKRYPYGAWYVFNAVHITKLEIFDEPKELNEFHKVGYEKELTETQYYVDDVVGSSCYEGDEPSSQLQSWIDKQFEEVEKEYQITKAPQSWCYVEVENE